MNARKGREKDEQQTRAVLEKFRAAIPLRETYEFSINRLNRLGVPLYCVATWTENGVYYDGFGYGAGETGAQTGAWDEIMENYFAGVSAQSAPETRADFAFAARGRQRAARRILKTRG